MAKDIDIREVAKMYSLGQRAMEHDISIIRKYAFLTPEEKQRWRRDFLRWFHVHRQLRKLEWINADEFFLPRYAQYMKDGAAFVVGVRERKQTIDALDNQFAVESAKPVFDDATVSKMLRAYADQLHVYVTDREMVVIPVVLQHYSPKDQRAAERGFRKRAGIAGVSLLLPWIMSRATEKEQEAVLAKVPILFRWIYRYRWEPAYQGIIPGFIADAKNNGR